MALLDVFAAFALVIVVAYAWPFAVMRFVLRRKAAFGGRDVCAVGVIVVATGALCGAAWLCELAW